MTRLIDAVHDHRLKRLLSDTYAAATVHTGVWEESADFGIRYTVIFLVIFLCKYSKKILLFSCPTKHIFSFF